MQAMRKIYGKSEPPGKWCLQSESAEISRTCGEETLPKEIDL